MLGRILTLAVALLLLVGASLGFTQTSERRLIATPHAELRGIGQQDLGTDHVASQFYEAVDTGVVPDIDRSLFVRRPDRLAGMNFEMILQALAAKTGTSAEDLFRAWWSQLDLGKDADEVAASPPGTCRDDPLPENLSLQLPLPCDNALAALAALPTPFGAPADPNFIVVGAVNRGDLQLPGDCGEYRLVVAASDMGRKAFREANKTAPYVVKLFINFEPTLPDGGDPALCPAVQRFWGSLSVMPDTDIAASLTRFFFSGGSMSSSGVLSDAADCVAPCHVLQPVISTDNMTIGDRPGQIRINANTGRFLWTLREFRFDDRTALVPVPVASTADYTTLSDSSPFVDLLAAQLVAQGKRLATNSFFDLGFSPPVETYANQQVSRPDTGTESIDPYSAQMGSKITAALTSVAADTGVDAKHLRNRLIVLSCAGCHHLSNANPLYNEQVDELGFGDLPTWRPSLDFTHISTTIGADDQYEISEALRDVFLPHRLEIMRKVIANP